VTFWRAIRDDYTFMQRAAAAGHAPFADLDSVFLLVNKSGIFRVASDMDVTQFQQYSAIGTGAKYALGALRVLYKQLDDPAEIARQAVQVGIDSDVYCGGTIDLAQVE
jgi:ATP-dependent protease HslVU (ClpYQ) peptidase subunit